MAEPAEQAADEAFIRALPKVELHLHIEGTLEPEMLFALARRNGVRLAYPDEAALRRAYDFGDLQAFLDLYYGGAEVLRTEADFYELTSAYLARMAAEKVRHVEIFFDPQAHTGRGVPFDAVVAGISAALEDARARQGISGRLILCFLRHLSEEDAFETLRQALSHRERIAAIGLDSGERGNPPGKFERVFRRARDAGFRAVAHAGEEGPADYVRQALDLLGVERIDHGVRAEEDPALLRLLAERRVPLTVCPLSNVRLKVFQRLQQHNLKRLLDAGLCVTVNSDDPAYFGGYLTDNLLAAQRALGLTRADMVALQRNAIEASFLPEEAKQALHAELRAAVEAS